MIAIYPSLRLAANGAVALLDGVDGGFRLIAIPDLAVLFAGSYENVVDLTLSGFGGSLGIRTTTDDLVVVRGPDRRRYRLPRERAEIRALAISDRGDRLALLLGAVLEIWSLPPAAAPLATVEVPAVERGHLVANPGFTRFGLLATTGEGPRFRAVFAAPYGDHGGLTAVWQETGSPLPGTSVAISDEWVWIAHPDGLIGWRGDDPPVTLPGTAFDSLTFSPTGSHLLAWHVERLTGPTSADLLFRLIDLASQSETARASYPVDDVTEAHPALTSDFTLLIARATRDGRVALERRDLSPI